MGTQTKLFTCPKCRDTYLGHDPLPDCPRCGYDYRVTEGFRWDVVVYLLSILALASFLLVGSQYRRYLGPNQNGMHGAATRPEATRQAFPESEPTRRLPFESPYHGAGR